MIMTFLTTINFPINLLFIIISLGFLLGKIKIKNISIGIAGVLFVAIIIGLFISRTGSDTYLEAVINTKNTMKIFTKLGSSLFISVIGIQTGFSIKKHSQNAFIAFIIGGIMSISGIMLTLLISTLDKNISYPSLLGVLCGSLTSTPGLSSVCEALSNNSSEVVLGYSFSYLFGVIFTVLFTQILSHTSTKSPNFSLSFSKDSNSNKIYPELIFIAIVSLLGNILGSITIPYINISLGNTAGTLLIGFILGYIIQKKISGLYFSSNVLNTLKTFGLTLFFAGTGFDAGYQTINFSIKPITYGIIITLCVIFSGIFLCKVIFRRYHLYSEFIIAGGITSSPAYGALNSQLNPEGTNLFSFAYFGALLFLIICIQIII